MGYIVKGKGKKVKFSLCMPLRHKEAADVQVHLFVTTYHMERFQINYTNTWLLTNLA